MHGAGRVAGEPDEDVFPNGLPSGDGAEACIDDIAERHASGQPVLVGTIDIFPTILEALGVDREAWPVFPDGNSFLPLVEDPSFAASEEFRQVFFSNWRPDGKRAARDDRYKLYTSLFGREEAMFDLAEDPFERVNLLARNRLTPEADAVRASLASRLDAWWCGRGSGGLACS